MRRKTLQDLKFMGKYGRMSSRVNRKDEFTATAVLHHLWYGDVAKK